MKCFRHLTTLSVALSLELFIIPGFPLLVRAQSPHTLLKQEISHNGEILEARTPFNPPKVRTPGNLEGGAVRRGREVARSRRPLRFKPIKVGAPGNLEGGATRGDGCSVGRKPLTAVMPVDNVGLTLAEYPTFFVYVPQTSAKAVEFVLLDEKYADVYTTTFTPIGTPGIVSIRLPADGKVLPLAIGKGYRWFFSMICDADDRSEDLVINGGIQRIEPPQQLVSSLQKAAVGERPTIYAEAGIWYDTIITLADLRRSSPNDLNLALDWTQLLESVGLNQISREPLVQDHATEK